MRPRLLDLFSGAGGCAKGYQEAGFYVVGVDKEPQPNYCGDEFVQADALDVLSWYLLGEWHRIPMARSGQVESGFDAIHASPPCQNSSSLKNLHRAVEHPELIPPTRELLSETSLPHVIENVEGAALIEPTLICGSMFDPPLDVRRHRLFETNWPLDHPTWGCRHKVWSPRFRSLDARAKTLATVVGVHGHLNYAGEMALREAAMGIDWMSPAELSQAIPPAYTRFIGEQLVGHLQQPLTTSTRESS